MYQQFVDKYPGKADFTKSYYLKKWQLEMDKANNPLMIPHLPILVPSGVLQQTTSKQPPEVQQQPPEVQQQPPEVQQQPPEVQRQPPEVQQQPPKVQQQPPEVQQQPPEVQQTVEVQTTEPDQLIAGMSLNEMSLAVEEIVNVLQSDRELMDIVEGLDLPDAVWDNELAIPDYLLEAELHW